MFLFFYFFFFFFQAEDGIRDFCLSRGLGDVYKRQDLTKAVFMAEPVADVLAVAFTGVLFFFEFRKALRAMPKSEKNN